jgi:hypothetical protein
VRRTAPAGRFEWCGEGMSGKWKPRGGDVGYAEARAGWRGEG